MPHFDTTGPVEVDIALSVGYAEVIASDRTDVTATVTPTVAGRPGDESLAAAATITFDGGRLKVRLPKRINLFGQSDSADVRVEVPTGSAVTVVNGYGSVRTRGELGAARVTADHGSVTLDAMSELVLVSRHGTVEVGDVAGRLDVKAGHGSVRVRRVGGDAVLRGAHGGIDLGTTAGSVDAATAGPLTIDRALGSVKARTAHGALVVREVNGGVIDLENGYLGIEVGVPEGVAAWVDASSQHGAVRNELRPDPDAAASDRAVELHLRAKWADVTIRRAAAAASLEARA